MGKNSEETNAAIGIPLVIISVIGIFGNLSTLIILWKNEIYQDRNQTRTFLAKLAFVDMMSSVNSMIQGVGYANVQWVQQIMPCYYVAYTHWFLRGMSLFAITSFTVNRYYTIVKRNMAGNIFNKCNTWIYIIGEFIVSGVGNLMLIFVSAKPTYEKVFGSCLFSEVKMSLRLCVISMVAVPCIFAMIYCNVSILVFARRHNKIAKGLGISDTAVQNRNRKMTRMVSIIVLTFLLCWMTGMAAIITKGTVSLIVGRTLRLLHNLNHVCNFFVYGIMDKKFRIQVKKLFCSKCDNQIVPS